MYNIFYRIKISLTTYSKSLRWIYTIILRIRIGIIFKINYQNKKYYIHKYMYLLVCIYPITKSSIRIL